MEYLHSTPGTNGYDPVAYHTEGKTLRSTFRRMADTVPMALRSVRSSLSTRKSGKSRTGSFI
jgi:hypothetical protein